MAIVFVSSLCETVAERLLGSTASNNAMITWSFRATSAAVSLVPLRTRFPRYLLSRSSLSVPSLLCRPFSLISGLSQGNSESSGVIPSETDAGYR